MCAIRETVNRHVRFRGGDAAELESVVTHTIISHTLTPDDPEFAESLDRIVRSAARRQGTTRWEGGVIVSPTADVTRSHKDRRLSKSPEEFTVEVGPEESARRERIDRALAVLSPKERQVVEAKADGRDLQQIAKGEGVSGSAYRMRLNRARKKIKPLLECEVTGGKERRDRPEASLLDRPGIETDRVQQVGAEGADQDRDRAGVQAPEVGKGTHLGSDRGRGVAAIQGSNPTERAAATADCDGEESRPERSGEGCEGVGRDGTRAATGHTEKEGLTTAPPPTQSRLDHMSEPRRCGWCDLLLTEGDQTTRYSVSHFLFLCARCRSYASLLPEEKLAKVGELNCDTVAMLAGYDDAVDRLADGNQFMLADWLTRASADTLIPLRQLEKTLGLKPVESEAVRAGTAPRDIAVRLVGMMPVVRDLLGQIHRIQKAGIAPSQSRFVRRYAVGDAKRFMISRLLRDRGRATISEITRALGIPRTPTTILLSRSDWFSCDARGGGWVLTDAGRDALDRHESESVAEGAA